MAAKVVSHAIAATAGALFGGVWERLPAPPLRLYWRRCCVGATVRTRKLCTALEAASETVEVSADEMASAIKLHDRHLALSTAAVQAALDRIHRRRKLGAMNVRVYRGIDEDVLAVEHIVREVFPSGQVTGPAGVGIDPIAVVAIFTPLTIFGKKFLDLAAEDGYLALKSWIARLVAVRKGNSVALRDDESGRTINLEADLPDEAYQQLLALTTNDLTEHRGRIVYDRTLAKWVGSGDSDS